MFVGVGDDCCYCEYYMRFSWCVGMFGGMKVCVVVVDCFG